MKEKVMELIDKCLSNPENESFSIKHSNSSYGGQLLEFVFQELPTLKVSFQRIHNGYVLQKETKEVLSEKWEKISGLVNELTYNFYYYANRNNQLIKPVLISESDKDEKNFPHYFDFPYYIEKKYDVETKYSTFFRRLFYGKMWKESVVEANVSKGYSDLYHASFGAVKIDLTKEEWDSMIERYNDFLVKKDLSKLNKRISSF